MKVLVLNSSSRRDGNSATMSAAVAGGAVDAGHVVDTVFLDDFVAGLLGDCRRCRTPDGACSIGDSYEELLLEHVLPADALVLATPLHYYGMTGRLKAFIDRLFCYTSGSALHGEANMARLPGKRVALVISCEESYQGATLGLVAQVQELTRYNRQDFVGVVVGVSNKRGEVVRDPADPIARAYDLGSRLFDINVTDYRLDTPRDNNVWAQPSEPEPPSPDRDHIGGHHAHASTAPHN